jgi:hypothetical protein
MSTEMLERWAPRLAGELRDLPEALDRELTEEADRLARTTARHAPRRTGFLARSFKGDEQQVTSTAPYAVTASEGGVIRARAHGWLLIPVRPGYRPGPGFVTVRARNGERVVLRAGTPELWAIRRREVRIRGSRYLERALEDHLQGAPERVADILPDVR